MIIPKGTIVIPAMLKVNDHDDVFAAGVPPILYTATPYRRTVRDWQFENMCTMQWALMKVAARYTTDLVFVKFVPSNDNFVGFLVKASYII